MQQGPRIGPYSVSLEGLPSLAINAFDSLRLRWRGVPALPGDTPAEVAKEVLRRNAGVVLAAGSGHFWFMWPTDFGKAIRGALRVLPPAYLRGLIDYMIRESFRLGRVPSCFTARHGFDMPWYRGDNLPFLLHSLHEVVKWTGDSRVLDENRPALQWLLDEYERTHFEDGLVSREVTGDWMDTILRPSSTFNNLCALRMLNVADALGLSHKEDPGKFARRVLDARWRGDHFTDYAGTEEPGVDAGVAALYFELFDRATREALIRYFEASDMVKPFPIRVTKRDYDVRLMPPLTRFSQKYHRSVWLHMGLMYINGLKRAGHDVSRYKSELDDMIMKYRNVVEAFDEDGRPYQTLFHSSEVGLTMAAGQYLELALG